MSQRRVPSLPDLPVRDRGTALALGALLAVVALVRLLPFPTVYHAGDVVLSSNDPYYYRYWVEQSGALGALPDAVAHGEPLLVATLRAVVAVLGPWSAGHVLAWYPVVSAIETALLVYVLAVRLTDDNRVGLAAVAFLAVTPAHAGRTGLGFADHHAFDYPWLVLTALALVVLLQGARREAAGGEIDRWPWLATGALAAGVAGQVLAWDNGALLVVPVGVAMAAVAPLAVRDARLLWRGLAPAVAGVGVAAGVVALAHVALGWHTSVVAFAPALLFAGCLAVLAVTALAARLDLDGTVLGAVLLFGAGVGALVATTAPGVVPGLDRGLARLFAESAIGETQSLLAPGAFVGPLMLLAFAPLFAFPAGAWAIKRGYAARAPGWLVGVTYLAYFLALALVQRRFVGELAPFAALFAGVGFVAFLAWFGLTRSPLPGDGDDDVNGGDGPGDASPGHGPRMDGRGPATDGGADGAELDDAEPEWHEREPATISVTDRTRRAFVGGISLVFLAPGALYSGFLYDQTNADPAAHSAAQWMRAYAAERGWAFPESRVFSEWGRSRMFNYFVNGESASYRFAQQHYESFLNSTDAEGWAEFLRGQAGFVVTTDLPGGFPQWSCYRRLHRLLGSDSGTTPGLSSFRAVYASTDGAVKVFTLVPGATITGEGQPGARVEARTTVELAGPGDGEPFTFEYVRRGRVEEDGSFALAVGQPGRYALTVGGTRTTVTLPDRMVENGGETRVNPPIS